jgi:hypothetical protein
MQIQSGRTVPLIQCSPMETNTIQIQMVIVHCVPLSLVACQIKERKKQLLLMQMLRQLFYVSKLRLCEESVSVLCNLCFQNFLYVKQGAYNFVSFSCSIKNY